MELTWNSVFAQQNVGDPMLQFFALGKESGDLFKRELEQQMQRYI